MAIDITFSHGHLVNSLILTKNGEILRCTVLYYGYLARSAKIDVLAGRNCIFYFDIHEKSFSVHSNH
jgi:hypothetical protein